MADNDPLLKALPPETDYLSYLTIIEYNLTKQRLPTLHNILQDTTLTTNIGWDLVHLLLPLLPDSEQCLQDVARLGNPREVVLKVTESLDFIANEEEEGEEGEDKGQDSELVGEETNAKDAVDGAKDKGGAALGASPVSTSSPAKEIRFSNLLSMLSILHPRIKTKYPSRFLSTSLQAILSAYSSLFRSVLAFDSILSFTKQISGVKRPALPPRKSSTSLSNLKAITSQGFAPDPEANEDGLASGEIELQQRLLQSFLTYVVEVYLSSPQEDESDVAGMSWAARYQETIQPEKTIPGRRSLCDLYAEMDSYHQKDATMGQILALSRDLGLKSEDLLANIIKNPHADTEEVQEEESELPSSPSDVALSRSGALYILCSTIASPILFHIDSPPREDLPDYTILVNTIIPSPSDPSLAAETPALLDALFFLGLYILQMNPSIAPSSDEEFNTALQRLSLLSANLSIPSQRFQAHQLTSTLLHLHPSDEAKLAYIRDTLEHCPYESLKGSAIGWLKTEILSANTVDKPAEKGNGLFSSPALLQLLASCLWPAITPSAYMEEEYVLLQNNLVFYLAVLNLVFLLLHNATIAENLGIREFTKQIMTQFVGPLMEKAKGFDAAFLSGDLEVEDEEVRDARAAEMRLLLMNCAQVVDKVSAGGS